MQVYLYLLLPILVLISEHAYLSLKIRKNLSAELVFDTTLSAKQNDSESDLGLKYWNVSHNPPPKYFNQEIYSKIKNHEQNTFKIPWNQNQTIPFYYYEGPKFPNVLKTCIGVNQPMFDHPQGDDLIFNQKIMNHPWRTKDPNLALIFVIPAFVNMIFKADSIISKYDFRYDKKPDKSWIIRKKQLWCNKKLTYHKVLNQVCQSTLASPFFKKSDGIDHILVSSNWRIRIFIEQNRFSSDCVRMFQKVYFGNYETLKHTYYDGVFGENYFEVRSKPNYWRCTISVPYVEKNLHGLAISDQEKENLKSFENWKNRDYHFIRAGEL